jgi:hypothetical protein
VGELGGNFNGLVEKRQNTMGQISDATSNQKNATEQASNTLASNTDNDTRGAQDQAAHALDSYIGFNEKERCSSSILLMIVTDGSSVKVFPETI